MNRSSLALQCDPDASNLALKQNIPYTEPREAMDELGRSIPRMPGQESNGGSVVRLEADIFARLEKLARSQGISTDQALHRLIDTGTGHLKLGNPRSQALSPKQTEVLGCLNVGLSVKEIGVHMGIKEGTVRTHILRLRASLDCSDLLSLRFQ